MEIANPAYLLIGFLTTAVGIVMWRWASRHNYARKLADANAQATLEALTKGTTESREKARERVNISSRQDISRFIGVVGFLLILGGLLLITLGLFAPEV
jgi:ABC-type transport system involved in cytochrome c biogenesis permease subunit